MIQHADFPYAGSMAEKKRKPTITSSGQILPSHPRGLGRKKKIKDFKF